MFIMAVWRSNLTSEIKGREAKSILTSQCSYEFGGVIPMQCFTFFMIVKIDIRIRIFNQYVRLVSLNNQKYA